MITPDKYMDLSNSVIKIAAYALKYIKKKKTIKYDALYKNMLKLFSSEALKYSFTPSLSFLFLLDLIEYDKNSDTIVLNETIKTVRRRRVVQKNRL